MNFQRKKEGCIQILDNLIEGAKHFKKGFSKAKDCDDLYIISYMIKKMLGHYSFQLEYDKVLSAKTIKELDETIRKFFDDDNYTIKFSDLKKRLIETNRGENV